MPALKQKNFFLLDFYIRRTTSRQNIGSHVGSHVGSHEGLTRVSRWDPNFRRKNGCGISKSKRKKSVVLTQAHNVRWSSLNTACAQRSKHLKQNSYGQERILKRMRFGQVVSTWKKISNAEICPCVFSKACPLTNHSQIHAQIMCLGCKLGRRARCAWVRRGIA